jgi:hypothetical protein
MSPVLEPRLAELRHKTDRQLAQVAADGVEKGFTLARLADAHYWLGEFESGERIYRRAEKTYRQSCALLPLARNLAQDGAAALEARLVQLRRKLDALAGMYGSLQRPACA